jgi:hypothetical protein
LSGVVALGFAQSASAVQIPVREDVMTSAFFTGDDLVRGFNGDATPENPFTVSAHGVNANPITSIIDNTNPNGTIDWLSFYRNNILPSDPAASTVVNGFGTFTFDVTALVNSWVDGTNPVHAIALTGKNDTSGNDFLHGFRNNNNNAPGTPDGFSVSNVTVPEPTTAGLLAIGLVGLGVRRRAR